MKNNKKIKLVFIVEVLAKGVGKHVADLYRELNASGEYDIYVLYGKERSEKSYLDVIDEDKRICVKNLNSKIGISDIKAIYEIKKILKTIKPDIVHCHSSKAGLSGRIAAKKMKVKKICYSPHAYYFLKYDKNFNIKKSIYIFAEKVLSRHYTNVTITTSVKEDEVYSNYNIDSPNKKVLIEHGVDIPNIKLDDRKKEKQKYNVENEIIIGSMARFVDQKDPFGTYEILRDIAKNDKRVRCIFWGNGEHFDEIVKMNERDGKYVILPGETKNADLSLSIIDIYLTASLYEGLPYTMVETLSLGKPIVSSKVIGNEDCVIDGGNGLFFTPGDYKKAVQNIENIINKNMFEKFGKTSKKIFNSRFSIKKMIEKYNKLYKGDNDD